MTDSNSELAVSSPARNRWPGEREEGYEARERDREGLFDQLEHEDSARRRYAAEKEPDGA